MVGRVQDSVKDADESKGDLTVEDRAPCACAVAHRTIYLCSTCSCTTLRPCIRRFGHLPLRDDASAPLAQQGLATRNP